MKQFPREGNGLLGLQLISKNGMGEVGRRQKKEKGRSFPMLKGKLFLG